MKICFLQAPFKSSFQCDPITMTRHQVAHVRRPESLASHVLASYEFCGYAKTCDAWAGDSCLANLSQSALLGLKMQACTCALGSVAVTAGQLMRSLCQSRGEVVTDVLKSFRAHVSPSQVLPGSGARDGAAPRFGLYFRAKQRDMFS